MSSILPPTPPQRPFRAIRIVDADPVSPDPAPGLHVTVHLAALKSAAFTLLCTVLVAVATFGQQLLQSGGLNFGTGQQAVVATMALSAFFAYVIKVVAGYRSGGTQ